MKITNCIQGTDEWFKTRAGKLTASNAQTIQANGKGLETYVYKTLAEKYSKNVNSYTNEDMQRGIELEDDARKTYEILHEKVDEVGFIELDKYTGCSPDGLVGKKGMIEIKCPCDYKFFKFSIDRKIETKYLWQMQMQMLVANREWCSYVVYNPNFDDNILIEKVVKDLAMQERLILGIESGKKLIKKITKSYGK